MDSFNKKFITSFLLLAFVLFVGTAVFAPVALAGNVELKNPLCNPPPNSNCDGNAWRGAYGSAEECYEAYGQICIGSFNGLITKIIKFVTDVVGALAVLMLVVAGIVFVTSAGNPEKATKAKQIAIYAVVGLAIALAARGLMEAVTAVITGA